MNDTSFDAFYRRNYSRLASSLSMVCNNKGLGEELAQEAFVKAYAKWSDVEAMDSPDGWLYRVAFNLARRQWKLSARRKLVALDEQTSATQDTVEDEDLRQAIARLPLKLRRIVVARYVLGYSTDEAADMLGMSPGALRVSLHRAVAALRLDPSMSQTETAE